jgi:hypothetical protein
MALTDAQRVKGALRIPAGVTVHDQRIGEIVGEVESDILQYLDLDSFDALTTYTDRIDVEPGGTGAVLMLRRMPVTAVVALTVAGVALAQGSDYYLGRGGALRMISCGVDAGRQDVVCTYTAGLITAGATPSWLARWSTLACARQYNQESMAGLAKLDVRPVNREVARFGFDEDACERELARYRARYAKPAG